MRRSKIACLFSRVTCGRTEQNSISQRIKLHGARLIRCCETNLDYVAKELRSGTRPGTEILPSREIADGATKTMFSFFQKCRQMRKGTKFSDARSATYG